MRPTTIVIASTLILGHFQPVLAFENPKRPILYPNAHFETMGTAAAEADIDDCWMLARETGALENSQEQITEDAANDAAALAAASAAAAAILGGDPHRAAVAGAAGGGAASLAAGRFYQSDPPPTFRRIVERCLYEKGYEVAGWE
jgi:hypothetical protein